MPAAAVTPGSRGRGPGREAGLGMRVSAGGARTVCTPFGQDGVGRPRGSGAINAFDIWPWHPWRSAAGSGYPGPAIPWPGVRQAARQCRDLRHWTRGAAVHGVTPSAPDTPARPSLAGRSPLLRHAPISRTRYMAPAVHGGSPRAPETPARPSLAGHSAGRAAVPRSLRLMHSTAVHGVTTPAPDTPARPSLAGRSPLLRHAPISRTRYMAPAVHGGSPRAPETPARPSL